jgi:hypothetical protein
MFGSNILEVAIAVVFVYFLLSLLCTVLNEWVARFLALRSRTLEDGIRNLLREDSQSDGGNLADKFYENALVRTLSPISAFGQRLTGEPKPSYIPSAAFAVALLDTIAKETGKEIHKLDSSALLKRVEDAVDASTQDVQDKVAPLIKAAKEYNSFRDLKDSARLLEADHVRDALVYTLDEAEKDFQFEQVNQAIEGLSNKKLQKTLLSLVDNAGRDLARAQKDIANWFDAAMERVSGWYKRKLALITLGFAFLITIALNADTINMVQVFASDTGARTMFVAAAEKIADEEFRQDADATAIIKEIEDEVQDLELPVGWSTKTGTPRSLPTTPRGWIVKIGGLLATTLLVSLGAPFWFDLLSKLSNLRGAGQIPKTAAEEGPGEE